MPVIPTYEAHVGLDPNTKGMPRERVSEYSAQAAEQMGRVVQQLGVTVGQVADHAAQQQQQAATFTTGLQERSLQDDLGAAYKNSLTTMPANGAGFTKSFVDQANQVAQQRFDQMPSGPAKERAIQTWETVGRNNWANHAFEQEYKQSGVYSSQQIGAMQDKDLGTVQQNPATVDVLFEQARTQIMNAPGLVPEQKQAALADYQRSIYNTELQTRFPNDPGSMREELHMAPPGSQGATFSRMLHVEGGGDPNAVSPKGALGVAQVMPDTARAMARTMGMAQVADMSDDQLQSYFAIHPDMNRQIGRAYFSKLLDHYGGDQEAAVVAYNAGPTRAAAWLARGKDDAVLPKETIDYRNKVLGPDYSLTHTVTTTGSALGSVGYDGSAATVNGKSFSAPTSPVQVARQFQGMDERTNRDTLTAFIQKSCGQTVDPSHIPWCASFADAVLGASGKQTLGSARASDFLNYGTPTNAPSQGDVVVFKPQVAGASGHVGFVTSVDEKGVHYIAGNDGNQVRENTLPLAQVAGFRVPPEAKQVGSDGAVFNSKYAALTFDDRNRLIAGAEAAQKRELVAQQQQAKLDSFNTQNAVDDDTASLAATGQGDRNLTLQRVTSVLGPEKAQKWQDDRSRALDTYKATAGMDSMTNDQLAAHAVGVAPTASDAGPGYVNKAMVADAVKKKAQAILKQRADDPAAVADTAAPVQAARQKASSGDPNAVQSVAQARMAQQASLGIPEGQRIPITKAEAIEIIAPVNNAPEGMDGPAMRQAIDRVEKMVGPQYAPRALQYMLNQGKVDNDTARMLSALLIKAQKGQPVTQTDVQGLNNVSAGAQLRSSAFMGGQDTQAPAFTAPTAPAVSDQVPTKGNLASMQKVLPAARIVPPVAAISSLVQNPSKAEDFDQMFGTGSAKKVLDKWRTMTGVPPDGR